MPVTSTGGRIIGHAACYLIPVAGLLTAGGVADGHRGFLIAAALAILAAPVVGFTRNQIALTEKGRRLATTVAEVRLLKEADSAAFTSFFMARYNAAAADRQLSAPSAPPEDQDASQRRCLEGCSHAFDAICSPARYKSYDSSPPPFWASLNDTERAWLLAVARNEAFPAGTMLCRQGDLARHVFIITAGQVVVCVTEPGKQRCIAVRGTGDIIGERAALEVRSRSATVIAVTKVAALVFTTSDFAAFLGRHPQVLAALERQVYGRLVEDRPGEPASHLADIAPGRPGWSGLNCSIFLADIAAFGRSSRNDKDRELLRAIMYSILESTFESSGVPWHSCYREDRGDGVLVIVPPETPTSLLIEPLSGSLATALAAHNAQATQATKMQLRVALNVGPVVSDQEGVCGESIILAARILEAPVLKRQLAGESANLGLIVSAYVYDTVVRHAPGQIEPTDYRRVKVCVKESRVNAWMCLLSGSENLQRMA